jgi:RNA polymerase sigma-70 factor (ECF subfamily)
VTPARSRTDAELLRAAQAGEPGAVPRLLERHLDRLWRLARLEALEDAAAHTLLETTLRSLPTQLPRLRASVDVGRWMVRELIAHARRSPPPPVEPSACADATLEALARLEPELRRAVVLRDVEGLVYDEIAEVLGLAPPTVVSRVHHARQVLAAAWEERS